MNIFKFLRTIIYGKEGPKVIITEEVAQEEKCCCGCGCKEDLFIPQNEIVEPEQTEQIVVETVKVPVPEPKVIKPKKKVAVAVEKSEAPTNVEKKKSTKKKITKKENK